MATDPASNVPNSNEIRQHLKRILESAAFRGSKRCQRFLEYVAECSLAGQADHLKERALAIDVFDRNPNSDLNEDSIVRVGAREVRKRLAQYYVSPEAAFDRVHVDLPSGSYVPEFQWVHAKPAALEGRSAADVHSLVSALKWWRFACVCLAVLSIALGIWLLRPHAPAGLSVVEQFWRPAFDAKEPLLIAMAHPLVYRPSPRAIQLSEDRLPPNTLGLQRPVEVAPDLLNGSDFLPVPDQYVGFGDALVATSVAGVFTSRSKLIRLRFADQVQFSDLRETPALLVGAFTNRWSMELMQGFRFRFDWARQAAAHISEAVAPHRTWALPERTSDERAREDYILLCRVPKSPTGGFLVIAAGLTQSGTEAAGTILSSPSHLQAVIQKLPPDWASKNLEVLLHSRVIGNAPSPPEVVAWELW